MRARLELTANRLRRSPWVTAVVALGIGVALALPAWNASDFYPAFVATYIGAALGFLVAIYIDHLKRAEDEAASRQVQEAADERERARVAEVTRTRRVAVLLLLRTELGHVPTQMEHRLSRDHPPSWDDPLTDILWRSLSSSGELRWIEDLTLLQLIASAYDMLATQIGLEKQWLEAIALAGPGKRLSEPYIASELRSRDTRTRILACSACKAMDAALKQDGELPGDSLAC